MKLVYTVLVLAALVYAERRLIEPRLTGARLSALVQAALVYKVLVYQEWIPPVSSQSVFCRNMFSLYVIPMFKWPPLSSFAVLCFDNSLHVESSFLTRFNKTA